jgi:alpha-1,2-mannosyltransferase
MTGAFAGVGVGLATAVKLTPGLFIVYFLVTRQWRVAFTAMGTTAGATVLAYVFTGRESATYFSGVIWDTNRVGLVDATPNQSLAGLLARAYDSPTTPRLMWFAFAMLLLAVGLSRARTAHAEGDELAAYTIVGLTANAICPISWTHHLVFLVPALVILFDSALRRRRAVRGFNIGRFPAAAGLRHAAAALGLYLLIVISPMWRYEHRLPQVSHYHDGLFGALMENSLALAIILLVVFLPWRQGAEPVFDARPTTVGRNLARSSH